MVLDLHSSPLGDIVGSDLRKVCSPHGAAHHGSGKAKGEIWQETEDSEWCHHSWIQFNGSKTHAVCVLSAVVGLMYCQQYHLHVNVASHARRPGLNISCTELLWLLVFDSLLVRNVRCLRFDL